MFACPSRIALAWNWLCLPSLFSYSHFWLAMHVKGLYSIFHICLGWSNENLGKTAIWRGKWTKAADRGNYGNEQDWKRWAFTYYSWVTTYKSRKHLSPVPKSLSSMSLQGFESMASENIAFNGKVDGLLFVLFSLIIYWQKKLAEILQACNFLPSLLPNWNVPWTTSSVLFNFCWQSHFLNV